MSTPDTPPTTTASAPEPIAPTSELFHGSARGETSWLWVALPVTGLLIVPLVGLVYAATSSFGRDSAASSASGAPVGDLGDGELDGDLSTTQVGNKKTPSKARRAPAKARTSQKPRTDGAAICCAKLEELGKTAPLESRGTYLAAARVCGSADDEETALKQARSAVKAARAEVPEECNP
jgi:hypothetical protein